MKTINLSNKTLAECTVTLKEVLLSSDNNEVNITGINKEKYEYLVISFNRYVRSNLARCKSYINNNFCLLGSQHYKDLEDAKKLAKFKFSYG